MAVAAASMLRRRLGVRLSPREIRIGSAAWFALAGALALAGVVAS